MPEWGFIHSVFWRFLAVFIGGGIGFALVINKARMSPDARRANRQIGGWILMLFGLSMSAGLTIFTISRMGMKAGLVALCAGIVLALLLVVVSGGRK